VTFHFYLPVMKDAGSLIGVNFRDCSCFNRSLLDMYVCVLMHSSILPSVMVLALSICCRQNGVNLCIIFFSPGLKLNKCLVKSLTMPCHNVKLMNWFCFCNSWSCFFSNWYFTVSCLLMSRICSMSDTSS